MRDFSAMKLHGALWFVAAVVNFTTASMAQGLLPDDPAVLANLPKEETYRDWLPQSVDLSGDFPMPGNQGNYGTCVGWAAGYALRSFIERQTHFVDMSVPANRFNPLYVYNNIAADCAQGTHLLNALVFMQSNGALRFRDEPNLSCPSIYSMEQRRRAAAFRIRGFHYIQPTQLDTVKGAISRRQPVLFAFVDTPDLHRLGVGEIYQTATQHGTASHAMVVVGYDEAIKAFKVINSWGTGWGDGGFGWISYDTFAAQATEAFTIDPLPNVSPAPGPLLPAPPTPDPVGPVPTPPAPDPLADLRKKIHELAKNLSCSRLSVTPAGAVAGFVQSTHEADLVREAAAGALTSGVVLRPWPQCEALITLHTQLAQPRGLSAELVPATKPCAHGTLCDGDRLAARINMPKVPAHLYVAYIQASGDTLILEQPVATVPTPRRPKEGVTIGEAHDQADFTVSAPFGREMLIALASESPLFDKPLPNSMTEREFLTVLREALIYKPRRTDPDRVVSAAVVPIVTAPR
jgi:hypothetical protein